ncbi:protein of unknown function [Burkholderia multivorans]
MSDDWEIVAIITSALRELTTFAARSLMGRDSIRDYRTGLTHGVCSQSLSARLWGAGACRAKMRC